MGIPVTGVALDGPEWGDPQYYNLFDAFGSPATNFPANTMTGAYFKHYGVTKLATVSIGASPSSTGNAKAIAESAEKAGIKVPIQDSIAATDSDFTSLALEMKSQGVNGIATEITTNQNVAIMGDVKTQGIDLKGTWFQGLYSQAILDDPASATAMEGTNSVAQFQPEDIKNDATKTFMSALKTVGYNKPNPIEGQTFGYFTALAAIEGLRVAGKNPTWGSFITNLRKVTNFTAGGLVAPVTFAKFGYTDPASGGNCIWTTTLSGGAWKPVQPAKYCGKLIPGTGS